MSWLRENATPPIVHRLNRDVLPPDSRVEPEKTRESALHHKSVGQIARKQGSTGIWSRNMLGLAASKTAGVTGVGTVHQYRRLLELGMGGQSRVLRLADRHLYRILSRDHDPALLFEYRKQGSKNEELGVWARQLLREGATCALAHAGKGPDPRVRGAAHKIATNVSKFLRSPLADNPFEKKGTKWILSPEATPPSVFSVAMIAYLSVFQRERAGFVARLGEYLGRPAPKKSYVLQFGRKSVQPTFYILGDPLAADSAGHPKDLPFALHWIEVLSRLGALEYSSVGVRILSRLIKECDEEGIWSPKKLGRSFAPNPSKLAGFYYPLESESRTNTQRRTDVTFRLALIARLLEWELRLT